MAEFCQKKLFVHLHIYYHNQIDYFVKKLCNINACDWDLFITYVEPSDELFRKFKTIKPDTIFLQVKNIGYDVYPFIQAIRTINLEDYEYILKLHTKAQRKRFGFIKSNAWRNNLVEFLLHSKKLFRNNLEILNNNKDIGLICNPWQFQTIRGKLSEETYALNTMMKRLNLHYRGNKFVAGTMFMARASIYKDIADSDICEDDFENESHTHSTSTNAHVLERVFSLIVYSKGYKIYTVSRFSYPYLFLISQKIFSITKEDGLLTVMLGGKHLYFPLPRKEPVPVAGTLSIKKEFSLTPLKHKRVAIFAGYTPEGKISEAQIYYLQELKKVVDNIIFVADSQIFEEELNKIKDLVCYCDFERHKGYDFYSYKKGIEYAKNRGFLDGTEQLILCNDSCYAPIFPFEDSFNKMEQVGCDFWGYTQNRLNEGKKSPQHLHLQSYFIVFNNKVFSSGAFNNFFSNIKIEDKVEDVIKKYELTFTSILNRAGFASTTFIPDKIPNINNTINKTLYPNTLVEKYHMPLGKVKVFNNKFISRIKEDSFDTLDYIESVNSELARIIRKENCM